MEKLNIKEKSINEIDDIVNEEIANLFEELKNGYNEKYLKYLEFCSNFHKYSAYNMMLIYNQVPNATNVAGYKAWENLGFLPIQKSIRILAPQPYKYIEINGKRIFYNQMTKEQKKDTKIHKKGTSYKQVSVYDISQCKQVKDKGLITNINSPLGNSEKEQYNILKEKIKSLDIKVLEIENIEDTEGQSLGGAIHINKNLDIKNKILRLLHELGHELLDYGINTDRPSISPEMTELRAESISYVVGTYLGLKNESIKDYLLSLNIDKVDFKEQLFKIINTSMKIIKLINE